MSITKREVYLKGLNERSYLKKVWLLSILSVTNENEKNKEILMKIPNSVIRENGKVYCNIDNELVEISDASIDHPLFKVYHSFDVKAGDHPVIKEDMETTVGILLANVCIMWESLREKHVYHNGEFTGGYLKKIVSSLMSDNPEGSKYGRKSIDEIIEEAKCYEGDMTKATVSQCLMITQMIQYLEGLSDTITVGGDEQAFTIDPKIVALRNELLIKHKDELDNPAVVEDIINTLVEEDKKIQLNGKNQAFYIAPKFIEENRKRMFLIFGMEPDFETGKYRLLATPTHEGWDLNLLNHYLNQGISASYDRGKNTGEGGSLVNEMTNLLPRVKTVDGDCGSKWGEWITVKKETLDYYKGSYYIKNGKVRYYDDDIESGELKVGDRYMFRMPTHCLTPENNICSICAGKILSSKPTLMMSEGILIATKFMLQRMKVSHVSSLSTNRLKLKDILI